MLVCFHFVSLKLDVFVNEERTAPASSLWQQVLLQTGEKILPGTSLHYSYIYKKEKGFVSEQKCVTFVQNKLDSRVV